MSDFIVLVPARYGSSRFPGKPLSKIHDKYMIEYVAQNCQESGFDYAIVTDNEEIESAVKSFRGNIVRVNDDVSTGSARIALAYERFFKDKGYKFVVNVQGDEPLLDANSIRKIGQAHEQSRYDIFTAVKKRSSREELYLNPNIVKCIKSPITNQCLYFSRASVPYDRDQEGLDWYQHIGVYSYRVEALLKFNQLEESYCESKEKLEQLRALENGMTIGACEIDINLIGVDTPEDIKRVEGVLSGK